MSGRSQLPTPGVAMRILVSIFCLLVGVPDPDDGDGRRRARLEESRVIVANAADATPPSEARAGDLPGEIRAALAAWLNG